ncbi:hybrid sensor histidine kinase/response regulator [Pelobacter propionicus]|uniref:histidine kinase n=1 Tax=Pelobacter propionicus (strain DSM 2379 / NBRC 103807 / OttBd1) TaxID=338966 RepID=A1AMG3_PELPD|nr:PAS domain S-box protein [Pelobacter propionicus]ABK98533.1 PAS/PAC sensor hybrid histidine kinase [Pelobacter propionicus DSM 2379]
MKNHLCPPAGDATSGAPLTPQRNPAQPNEPPRNGSHRLPEREGGGRHCPQPGLKDILARYLDLFDLAPVGYVTISQGGTVVEANLTFAAMVGVQRDSLAGEPLERFITPEEHEAFLGRRTRLHESQERQSWEMRMLRDDGSTFWAQLQAIPEREGESWITLDDITARKRDESDLELKSFTLDNLAEEVLWLAADGTIWNINQVACEKLGYNRDELLNLSVMDINPQMTKEGWRSFWEELKQTGNLKLESSHRTRDGRCYPTEVVANYFNRNGFEYCYSIVRDITAHKNLEKALQDSEEQFRTLCNSAPIGIFSADREGNSILSNPRWEEIAGLSAAECIGKGWTRAIHPDDREEQAKTWLEAMSTGRVYSHEYRLLTPLGKTIWVRALANPIKDPDGTVLGYVWTVEDITELQQSRQEILKTQKLESLGVLAGGIAHDFNNILTAILGNISLARLQLNDTAKVTKRLEEAETATTRAKDLTRQLITFARGGEPLKKNIDVSSLLREATDFALHGSNVKCRFDLPDDIWMVEADEAQLSQVIHNLVFNAIQAMPGGGTISIGASNVVSQEGGRKFVKISVTDTGTGIPAHHMQQIFDPYFSTKENSIGLGLATCHSILKKHGGKIRAASTLGRGSTFLVSLPAADQADEAPSPSAAEGSNTRRHILVMDDEEMIRELAEAILTEFGYSVECVESGAQAIELYAARKEENRPFSAVILDLTIPGGIGGRETMEKLRSLDPHVRAIVSSGYSDDPVVANFREHGFSAVLSKPYRPQEMGRVLQELFAP